MRRSNELVEVMNTCLLTNDKMIMTENWSMLIQSATRFTS